MNEIVNTPENTDKNDAGPTTAGLPAQVWMLRDPNGLPRASVIRNTDGTVVLGGDPDSRDLYVSLLESELRAAEGAVPATDTDGFIFAQRRKEALRDLLSAMYHERRRGVGR